MSSRILILTEMHSLFDLIGKIKGKKPQNSLYLKLNIICTYTIVAIAYAKEQIGTTEFVLSD